MMNRHGKAATRRHLWDPQTAGEPRLHKMSFPAKDGRRQCPVEGCTGVSATRASMRVHFVNRHVHNTVVILEEGNLPLSRCPRCDLPMSSHMITRHGKAATRRHLWAPQTTGEPRLYKINFPARGGSRQCPVEGCPGVSATQAAMRAHFLNRHVHDTVVILEEGNLPLPRCPRCDLQVSRKALHRRHLETSQCRTGTERKRRRLAEAELETKSEKAWNAFSDVASNSASASLLFFRSTPSCTDWSPVGVR